MLKPLNNNVVLKKEKVVNKTASGIILSTKEEESEGISVVVAVSEDVKNINVNDRVIYKKYSTTDVKFNDETYYIVDAKDILAIIKED